MTYLAQYHCCSDKFSVVVSPPTDVFTIYGSNTRRVRILKMGIICTQTISGINIWRLVKRTTPNTDGISANPLIVASDSNFPSATALVTQYIEAPNVGVTAGFLEGFTMNSTDLTGNLQAQNLIIDFTSGIGHPIILNGSNESLSWNFNGVSSPNGMSVLAFAKWTEEI